MLRRVGNFELTHEVVNGGKRILVHLCNLTSIEAVFPSHRPNKVWIEVRFVNVSALIVYLEPNQMLAHANNTRVADVVIDPQRFFGISSKIVKHHQMGGRVDSNEFCAELVAHESCRRANHQRPVM